ncbi:MAG: hypothetical protein BWZ10_02127 [candidate division BRC1 bacterium ADurb.BinA364]|nr:MAG: hypothetical protein BWZ10_02127 [candidate division BRC1 bacterium ADurb.BinA364]
MGALAVAVRRFDEFVGRAGHALELHAPSPFQLARLFEIDFQHRRLGIARGFDLDEGEVAPHGAIGICREQAHRILAWRRERMLRLALGRSRSIAEVPFEPRAGRGVAGEAHAFAGPCDRGHGARRQGRIGPHSRFIGAEVRRLAAPGQADGRAVLPLHFAVKHEHIGAIIMEFDLLHPRQVVSGAHGDPIALFAFDAKSVVERQRIHHRQPPAFSGPERGRQRQSRVHACAFSIDTKIAIGGVGESGIVVDIANAAGGGSGGAETAIGLRGRQQRIAEAKNCRAGSLGAQEIVEQMDAAADGRGNGDLHAGSMAVAFPKDVVGEQKTVDIGGADLPAESQVVGEEVVIGAGAGHGCWIGAAFRSVAGEIGRETDRTHRGVSVAVDAIEAKNRIAEQILRPAVGRSAAVQRFGQDVAFHQHAFRDDDRVVAAPGIVETVGANDGALAGFDAHRIMTDASEGIAFDDKVLAADQVGDIGGGFPAVEIVVDEADGAAVADYKWRKTAIVVAEGAAADFETFAARRLEPGGRGGFDAKTFDGDMAAFGELDGGAGRGGGEDRLVRLGRAIADRLAWFALPRGGDRPSVFARGEHRCVAWPQRRVGLGG